MFNVINMNNDENTNTFIHNLIEDFQQDLSGNPRMLILNNETICVFYVRGKIVFSLT